MVRSVFSTTTFCYRPGVHLLHPLPVLNLSDPNSQTLQFKSPTQDSCCDLEIIIKEDTDDEPYRELAPISASKPLNPEAADFRPAYVGMPAAVENPEADGDGMENPMQTDSQQVHRDPLELITNVMLDIRRYLILFRRFWT